VRLAAPHQSAQICDQDATGDMPINIVEHFACLPCQQTFFSGVRGSFHRLWFDLSSQQRGRLEYRAACGLFLAKVANGRIQERHDIVHPDLSLHC